MSTPDPRPTLGRVVIVRNVVGKDFAATVCAVHDDGDTVDLVAYSVTYGTGTVALAEVPYSATPEPGTWRWPERV